MTQYKNIVDRQKTLMKAEKWAKTPSCLHTHSIQTMWYDNRPEDTADGNGPVTDVQYNSGIITRTKNDKVIHTWGTPLKGDDLIDAYLHSGRNNIIL